METNLIYNHIFKCERLNEPKLSYNEDKSIMQDIQAENILRNIYAVENIDLGICEMCIALLVNRRNKVVGYYKVSQGGIDSTTMDIKMITKAALDTFSSGVILCHNHPSGSPKPSRADVDTTERLRKALQLFDISLIDHIILTEDNAFYFSSESCKYPMRA